MRILRCCALGSLFWMGTASAAEAQCSFTLTPTAFTVESTAASRTLSIITGTQCTWTAVSNAGWIAITSGAAGTGIGSVTLAVQQNATSAARTGTVTVAGQTVSITQYASSCAYSLTPTSFSITAAATSRTLSVVSGTSCGWTSSTTAPWIVITSGASGSGVGAVSFDIAANSGSARTGILNVGGQSVTIVQWSEAENVPPPTPANLHIVR